MNSLIHDLTFRALSIPGARQIFSSISQPGIMMLHQGRCGSTVVANQLSQHPQLLSAGEVFEPAFQNGKLPGNVNNMLIARRASGLRRRVVVETKFLECMHLSIIGVEIEKFLQLCNRNGFRQYIVLDRRNRLESIISALVGRARGNKWHFKRAESVPETRVKIDIDACTIQGMTAPLLTILDYYDSQYAKLYNAMNGIDTLSLSYEDDIKEDPAVAYQKICNWLQIELAPTEVSIRRSSALSAAETVENWDDVAAELRGTKHEWMLTAP